VAAGELGFSSAERTFENIRCVDLAEVEMYHRGEREVPRRFPPPVHVGQVLASSESPACGGGTRNVRNTRAEGLANQGDVRARQVTFITFFEEKDVIVEAGDACASNSVFRADCEDQTSESTGRLCQLRTSAGAQGNL